MIVKLLTEHHLEFLSLKVGCTDSSGSTLVKMPHCWKFHALAQLCLSLLFFTDSPDECYNFDKGLILSNSYIICLYHVLFVHSL